MSALACLCRVRAGINVQPRCPTPRGVQTIKLGRPLTTRVAPKKQIVDPVPFSCPGWAIPFWDALSKAVAAPGGFSSASTRLPAIHTRCAALQNVHACLHNRRFFDAVRTNRQPPLRCGVFVALASARASRLKSANAEAQRRQYDFPSGCADNVPTMGSRAFLHLKPAWPQPTSTTGTAKSTVGRQRLHTASRLNQAVKPEARHWPALGSHGLAGGPQADSNGRYGTYPQT
ncbi:hypothetical protein PCL_09559 [Purpureocillium lilacinum]|uniref:Uncharacterized protein n=1 Tax=Purpureocillium lilacinum TaxID=33203 RepID=A0A2U3DQL1_PURLI|nr:hypothetical protein PCL_09559 [Purpureocillium lilacinum]